MYKQKLILCSLLMVAALAGIAQTVSSKLAAAVQQMEADASLKHAIVSICVFDAGTGKAVYTHNAQMGMAPASSQKIFTSVAAFDLLGHDYMYKTRLGYDGANVQIKGSCDPTFGSWRWKDTKPEAVLAKIISVLQQRGVTKVDDILLSTAGFSIQPLPGGWIWDDIGNYYGAGSWAINWHENQYDLHLSSGKEGDTTVIERTEPEVKAFLNNQITAGKKGSGDNGWIYLPPYTTYGFTQGTVPPGSSDFVISGAFPDAPMQFGAELKAALTEKNIQVSGGPKMTKANLSSAWYTFLSPPMDSINYWFMRKSINLYGEALLKTMAYEKTGVGSTEKGVELLRDFWSERGVEKSALKIMDGSGLSPQNRVTTDAQVKALLYAKTRPWFNSFFAALPEYNGMKMKSGTIGGSKAFAGYHKNYVFSIIVNNFDGGAGAVVQRMYGVLDVLK